ncbi:MAG TPA: hypothetical protein VK734_01180 [Bradyrhizobium sp.]|nr:hypothetical protein [Bradyrhizobium sp.]
MNESAAKSQQSELDHTAEAMLKALIGISFAAISNMNAHASGGPYSTSTAKLETL